MKYYLIILLSLVLSFRALSSPGSGPDNQSGEYQNLSDEKKQDHTQSNIHQVAKLYESREDKDLLVEFEQALITSEDQATGSGQNPMDGKIKGTLTNDRSFGIDQCRKYYYDIGECRRNHYISLNAGVLNFPYIGNIQTVNGAGGFGFGTSLTSQLKLELSFFYSFQQAEINQLIATYVDDIDQYSFNAVGAYQWNRSGSIHPITGVAATLTRRQYNLDENSSNAFDLGLVGGVDVDFSKNLSFGVEYRYMINIDYEREVGNSKASRYLQKIATGNDVKHLESFDYQVVFINTKIRF